MYYLIGLMYDYSYQLGLSQEGTPLYMVINWTFLLLVVLFW